MSKHCSDWKQSQVPSRGEFQVRVSVPMLGALVRAGGALQELCVETGRQVLVAMMEGDREALCGPKGRHDPGRRAYRAGSVPSRVTLGGRQIELPRLRARGAGGELALSSFLWAAGRDPLDAHTLKGVAGGVSTRRYRASLDPLPAGLAEYATSRSAVSRRFVALSTRQMGAFLSRRLEALDLQVVLLDGKVFQGHCLLIALGLDSQGNKHILGLREGSTENACVARALLADLVERGLPTDRAMLFVIDGAKALRKAVRGVFGELGLVQRCQQHKRRNFLDHLPKTLQASLDRVLREAWDEPCVALAERRLSALACSLEREHPGAAASLREGLEETLTVTRLGLSGALHRSLRTTNLIESLNSSIETYTGNVKRWRGGAMAQRWVSAALLDAEKRFRRVRGHRDLPLLATALDARSPGVPETARVA